MSAGIPIDLDVRPFSRSNVTDLNLNGSLKSFHIEPRSFEWLERGSTGRGLIVRPRHFIENQPKRLSLFLHFNPMELIDYITCSMIDF